MFKTVVVLNEDFAQQPSVLLNATGHLAQSIGAQLMHAKDSRFIDYRDGSGNTYPAISWWPIIILRGRSNKMRTFFSALEIADAPRSAFLDSMLEGGSEIQLARTKSLLQDNLRLIAVAGFGSAEALAPLTQRFSIWRPQSADVDPSGANTTA